MSQETSQSIEDDVKFVQDSMDSEEQYPLNDDLPIHEAAAKGDISTLTSLVASGVDINIRNSHELTPLHLAIHGNHAEAVRILLSAGADPALEEEEPCYGQRYTAVDLAAFIGSGAALAVLIDEDTGISARSLYLAASINRVECIDTILQKLGQRDFSDSPRLVGIRKALDRAALCWHSDAIDYFLTRIEGFPDTKTKEDRECLGHAIYSAAHEYDCDDRCRSSDNVRGKGPQVYYNVMEKLIVAGGDVNIEVPQSWMPQGTFEFLLQNGLRVDHAADGRHITLFDIIGIINIDTSLVEAFLDKGAKATITDTELNTPLHFAAHRSFAELLCKHGADLFSRNAQGKTPFHSACERGRLDVAEFLLANGADLSSKNAEGKTPFYSACEGGHLDVVQFLVGKGASISDTPNDGPTALHVAASRRYTELVRYLIEQGADIEARDKTGATALYLSYPWGTNVDTFNLLLQKDADRQAADNEGKTVLDLIDHKKWQFDEQGLLQVKPEPQIVWQEGAGMRGRGGWRGGGRGVGRGGERGRGRGMP